MARYVHCSAGSGKLLVTNYTQCLKQSCLGQYRKVNAYNMVGCESFVRCNRIVEYGVVFLFLSSTANQRAKKRFFVLYFFLFSSFPFVSVNCIHMKIDYVFNVYTFVRMCGIQGCRNADAKRENFA